MHTKVDGGIWISNNDRTYGNYAANLRNEESFKHFKTFFIPVIHLSFTEAYDTYRNDF